MHTESFNLGLFGHNRGNIVASRILKQLNVSLMPKNCLLQIKCLGVDYSFRQNKKIHRQIRKIKQHDASRKTPSTTR